MLERLAQEQPTATPPAPSAGSIDINMDLSGASENACLSNTRSGKVRMVRSAAGECGERQRETERG
jgi:hypothetical protein